MVGVPASVDGRIRRSLVLAQQGGQHSIMEINHEVFSVVIFFPSVDSKWVIVNLLLKNAQVLVNH